MCPQLSPADSQIGRRVVASSLVTSLSRLPINLRKDSKKRRAATPFRAAFATNFGKLRSPLAQQIVRQAPLHSQTDESLDEPPAERARERLPNALEAFLERCFGRSFEDGVSCPSAQNPSQALMARARESLRRAWANFLDSWFARPRVGEFYVISPQLDDRRLSLSSIGRVPSRETASPHMDQGIAEGTFTAKSPSGPTD